MNEYSRYNYQKGIPENRLYSGTRYDIESPLDEYIVATKRIRDRFQQERKEKQEQEALEKYIQEQVEKALEDCLEKSLSSVLEKFK